MSGYVPPARLRGVGPSAIRRLFDRAPAGSINLGLGEPDLEPPEGIRRAAIRAVESQRLGYTAQAGLPALREAIAADHSHLDGDAGRVMVTAGAQEALFAAILALVDTGDEVLLPDPGFVAYETIVRMAGGTPVFYPLRSDGGFAFDPIAFRRAVSRRTKLAVVNSPSNPTGRVMSRTDLESMAEPLDAVGAFVLSDEIYRELYFSETRPASMADVYSRTLVAGGLSKSLSMTGWRLGWLCSPSEVAPSALALHGYVTTCASAVSQHAALAAWEPDARAAVADARRVYRARRDGLRRELAEIGIRSVDPDGAFYVMAETSAIGTSVEVSETLLDRGVITVPGSAFGAQGEGYTRLSLCCDGARLDEAVARIASVFSEEVRHRVVEGTGRGTVLVAAGDDLQRRLAEVAERV